jgi:hypothetical protein
MGNLGARGSMNVDSADGSVVRFFALSFLIAWAVWIPAGGRVCGVGLAAPVYSAGPSRSRINSAGSPYQGLDSSARE